MTCAVFGGNGLAYVACSNEARTINMSVEMISDVLAYAARSLSTLRTPADHLPVAASLAVQQDC